MIKPYEHIVVGNSVSIPVPTRAFQQKNATGGWSGPGGHNPTLVAVVAARTYIGANPSCGTRFVKLIKVLVHSVLLVKPGGC